MNIRKSIAILAGLGAAVLVTPALAQFPEKAITLVVPYGPGGLTDTVARTFGEALSQSTGQSVVVENKPGAGGIVAIEYVARQRPDGYTLLVGNVSTNGITPVIDADKFSIDYVKDITPIARLAMAPGLLVTGSQNKNLATLDSLVKEAKAAPGSLRYSSAGIGSYTHFDNALLDRAAGMQTSHVPASTGAQGMVQGLLNGDAHFAWLNVSSGKPLVEDGQLIALGVNTEQRLPEIPDVPTMAELGYPGIGTYGWQGLFAPAGVPEEVLERLFELSSQALASDLVQRVFKERIILDGAMASRQEVRDWISSEMTHWKQIAQDVPIR